ncbi:MAG: hypothetical protein H6710_10630 [Myxococcales bacterium]|nr:hypothetical protein [Myxococcales bacterium]
MSYVRDRFASFAEFQRETSREWGHDLGKEEIEHLGEIEDDERFYSRPRKRRRGEYDY